MTEVLRILIAPLVWLASFSAIYGLHGLLCQNALAAVAGFPAERAVLMAAYGVAIAFQIILLWILHHPRFAAPSGLLRLVSRASGWTGLIASVWTLFPVVALPTCF